MWVDFAADFLPCSEGFFAEYSGFPLSLNKNTSKFLVDLQRTDTFQRTPECSVVSNVYSYNYNVICDK